MIKNILFISIPLIIYFTFSTFIENQKDLILISLILTTISYWALNTVPLYFSSLIFLFAALTFSLSTKEVIFSGFASSAFWLVIAGMLIASAIQSTKLSNRFSNIFAKIENLSYLKLLIYISIFSLLFSFIMPSSTVRIVLLIPISIALCKSLDFEINSKGYIGVMLTFILSTSLPAFTILPANVPNMILAGLTKQIYDYEFLYSFYMFANFFVLGFIKNILIVFLIYFFFKDTVKKKIQKQESKNYSKQEKIVLFTILIMLTLWLSDFIHKVSPSVIAIIGVLFLAYPKIGIIKQKDINNVNFASLIYVAAIISLGSIIADNAFIKDSLTQLINQYKNFDNEILNYMAITSFMSFSGVILTQPTIPAIYTPLSENISQISSFTLTQIFTMQVAAFSNVFFPFQAPPLVVGLALSKIKQKDMLKILLVLAFITIIFLYPLQYFYLQFIS